MVVSQRIGLVMYFNGRNYSIELFYKTTRPITHKSCFLKMIVLKECYRSQQEGNYSS